MSSIPRARGTPNPGRAVAAPAPGHGEAEPEPPRSGDVIEVTRNASVQFTSPMLFRVIRVIDWPTYTGWIWLDGYQLNAAGDAVDRRSIFVQASGLRKVALPRRQPGRR